MGYYQLNQTIIYLIIKNVFYLNTYYLLCKTQADRNEFIKGFDKAMDLDKKEGNK